jgi:HNH endonuclease
VSAKNTVAEFWERVRKTETCWIWTDRMAAGGYGSFSFHGKQWRTHRFSWTMHFGEIPQGLKVCHRCDNPLCIRPDHLFVGTQRENVEDAFRKGRLKPYRRRVGVNHHMAKLTAEDVVAMRELRNATGVSYQRIARRFKVSTMTAYRAVVGQAWKEFQ